MTWKRDRRGRSIHSSQKENLNRFYRISKEEKSKILDDSKGNFSYTILPLLIIVPEIDRARGIGISESSESESDSDSEDEKDVENEKDIYDYDNPNRTGILNGSLIVVVWFSRDTYNNY